PPMGTNAITKAAIPVLLFLLTLGVVGGIVAPAVSHAVTVGPVKLEYTVDPGGTVSGQLFLANETGPRVTFYPTFERFAEENGQKVFTKETSDLATWFRMPASVTLNSGQSKQIPFTIRVPSDASPGGHFAVIWWSTTPPGPAGQQVSIVTRAGILVFLRVSGDIVEKAHIDSFSPNGRFFTGFPISFSIAFTDEGNVSLKPIGEVRITNIFGALKASLKVNEGGSIVLPGNSKGFSSAAWDTSGFFFGPYKAALSLTYGESKQIITESYWFFVASWNAIIAILGILLVFFIIPKAIKRYNLWIISKHTK
ncbi:MAG: hypothetical protein V1696_03625, partial [Candidatus Jorgensenbacteria bacterium]